MSVQDEGSGGLGLAEYLVCVCICMCTCVNNNHHTVSFNLQVMFNFDIRLSITLLPGQAVALSEDQKPSCAAEAARIVEKGGYVTNGRIFGQLAVARAMGDRDLKEEVIGALTCEPEIVQVRTCTISTLSGGGVGWGVVQCSVVQCSVV